MTIAVHPTGALLALAVLLSVVATLWWMLHPPRTRADVAARRSGSRALGDGRQHHRGLRRRDPLRTHDGARGAPGAPAALRSCLPSTSSRCRSCCRTPRRRPKKIAKRCGVLATAEAIARKHGANIHTEIVHARRISTAALDLARNNGALPARDGLVPRGQVHRRAARPRDRRDHDAREVRRAYRRSRPVRHAAARRASATNPPSERARVSPRALWPSVRRFR